VTHKAGTAVAIGAATTVIVSLAALMAVGGLPALGLGSLVAAATVLGVRLAWFGEELAPIDLSATQTVADEIDDDSTVKVSEQQARDAGIAEGGVGTATETETEIETVITTTRASDHDPTTGLWSRAALERALATASGEPSWAYPGRVVMFVVFDDFNTIVDAHGRDVGREVFAAASQRLMACLRPGDIAVRHGIDGFVILLEKNAVMATARPVAERVIMAMAFPFMVADEFVAMGACVGLTVSNGDLTPDGLLLTGIGAASIAKRAGRGHFIQVT
jgi:diguanylate cyclase (GGDEF)-like protein